MATLPLDVTFRDHGATRGLAGLAKQTDATAQAAQKLETAETKLAAAERKSADAAGQVRLAELKLQDVRSNAKSTAAQRLAAEEKLAAAQRRLTGAQKDVTSSSRHVVTAQKQVQQASQKTSETVKDTTGQLRLLGRTGPRSMSLVGTGATALTVGMVAAGAAATKFGLSVASGNEQAKISFTTMLGSAQKAETFLKQLQQFAATTPFEFPELQTAASSLISAGIEAQKVIPIMRTLGDVTSGMGTGAEGVKRATIALQQMNAAGRITAEDLNQLRDAGVPVYDLLAAATHKSKEEVAGLVQQGKLGKEALQQLMHALESGAGLERFNGLMNEQSKSLAGMASTLKDVAGQTLAGWLTPLFPALKASIGALADMSSGMKTTIAIVGTAAVTFGVAAKGAMALSGAFQSLGLAANTAKIAVGGVGAVLGVAAIAFGVYAKSHAEAKQRVADFTTALQGETEAVQKNVEAVAAKQLQDAGAFKAAQTLGLSLDTVTQAALGQWAAVNDVNAVIDQYVAAGLNSADVDANIRANAANDLGKAIGRTGGAYNKAVGEAQQMEEATGGASDAMGTMEKKTKSAHDQLTAWRQELYKSARASMELEASQDDVEAAIDDATDSVKKNGKTLDSNTEKGRANRAALRNLASSSINYREKLIEQGAKQKDVTRATNDGRQAFIKSAEKMGLSRKKANELADAYGLLDKKIRKVPKNPTIKLTAKFHANATKAVVEMLKYVPGSQASGFANALAGRAEGGEIPGRSPHSKADNILVRATAGEFMQQKKAVDYYGLTTMKRLNEGKIPREAIRGYADGGPVYPNAAPSFGATAQKANRKAATAAFNRGYNAAAKELNTASMQNVAGGLPGGGRAIGKGQAALIRYGRMLGMGASSYPGHHPSQAKARDFMPVGGGRGDAMAGHAWAHAKQYGVWYVIWNKRIASRTRAGAGWRPYTRYGSSGSPSQMHTNHVHVAWYDRGGLLRPGQSGTNMSGQPERVLSPPMTRSFDRLVRVMDRSGGAANTYITVNAPNYVGSQDDLRRTLVDMNRRGQLEVIKGR